MNMGTIIEAILDGVEKEAAKKNQQQVNQFLKEHPIGQTSPELFNSFFDADQELIKNYLISIYFPETKRHYRLKESIAQWNYICKIVGDLIKKKHGTGAYCMDCARWITDKYISYIADGSLPDMEIDEHYYWKPKFGSAQQWMTFCASIIQLYYGNPTKFIEIYSELNNEPIKSN